MVKKRFEIVLIKDNMIAAYPSVGSADFFRGPARTFKGIAYTYVCTKDAIYSTNSLQIIEKKEEGDN